MAKQVLGRNLGALLDESAKEAGRERTFAPNAASPGSGVRSLMRGHQETPAAPTPVASKPKPALPGWYLLGGDMVLAVMALVIVGKSPHPLTWQKEVFCAAAVTLGGCLALAAVLSEDDQ